MLTYQDCQNLIQKGKDGRKKLVNNTYLEKLDDCFGILLHNTFVVKIFPNNHYQLNSGKWKTPTTKNRINQFSPAQIAQVKGNWVHYLKFSKNIPFFDGMIINSKGNPVK